MNLFAIRLQKLFHALRSPRGRRALMRNVAASIEHTSAIGSMDYKTIVDVGANVGQFALFARERWPHANILSFEPLDDCWQTFNTIFGTDNRVQLFKFGVGSFEGEVAINVANENDSSSILQPSTTQADVFGTIVNIRKKVTLRRLGSTMHADQVASPALLKIDVQGFELDVLKGCEDLLQRFHTVYVEASYVELYEGQALAGEVIEFLHRHGFILRGIFNQHVDKHRGPLQADFLFRQAGKS
ncbi:FkbM family methyltransferase [Bradyrhizobium sp. DASA03007]|uniref:FkbM family methyltransferase n=1 Tax=unclassified Bradyrhizobium TaxID=2631580 RepID=UPI003F72CFE1